ncbi:hypothetical protein WBJ53_16740 [Spirosoma sp. SC4-14]|uniref:hypothetical protein n=1 Tax=Spirosoma sp. SC4-14 TaxID=3128900 RepID=UPI0030CB17E3
MPAQRKFPIRILVDGKPVQVRSIGGDFFCSKRFIYQAAYDPSGHLVGRFIRHLPQVDQPISS